MKALCIGHAAYDTTVTVPEYPKENIKYRVDERVECGGGPASNAAYLLRKWGVKTYFAGLIGKDVYGKKIREEFEQIGVNTKYLEANKNHSTTTSFIVANKTNGSRTVFAYRPSNLKMTDFELDFIPDLILVDGQEPEISKKMIKRYPRAISVIDAGRNNEEIYDLCKIVDYVACSKDFAENLTGIKINYTYTNTIVEAYNILKEKFSNANIVITLEDKGCVYTKDGSIKMMPSIKVKPVDSTGAGDIFHGALAYGLINRLDYEKALRYANIAGGLSVEKVGGRFSIPTLEEVQEKDVKY